jgi:hypothetical protein
MQRKPLELHDFFYHDDVLVCIELAESDNGSYHVYTNEINYSTGKYEKKHIAYFNESEREEARELFDALIMQLKTHAWEAVPDGVSLNGLGVLLSYTKKHMENFRPHSNDGACPQLPLTVEEGFRNLEI